MSPSDATSMRRVLLVEDDDILRRNYETLLGAHHLSVCGCGTKSDAIAAFSREAFDICRGPGSLNRFSASLSGVSAGG